MPAASVGEAGVTRRAPGHRVSLSSEDRLQELSCGSGACHFFYLLEQKDFDFDSEDA